MKSGGKQSLRKDVRRYRTMRKSSRQGTIFGVASGGIFASGSTVRKRKVSKGEGGKERDIGDWGRGGGGGGSVVPTEGSEEGGRGEEV